MELHIAQKEFRVQALDTAQEGKGKKKLLTVFWEDRKTAKNLKAC